ncbi:unnamed protein product [Scytosiphon promiscuus]
MAEALKIALVAEVRGLVRKRGKETSCAKAVVACVQGGEELLKRAAEVCDSLDIPPRVDLKECRRVFSELRQRQFAQIAEEEKLWAIEEQKCLALAESTKRAEDKMKAFDQLLASGKAARSAAGDEELRVLLEPLDDDEEESIKAIAGFSWRETADRLSKEVIKSINDMIRDTSAIGRGLQEMGADVANGQEIREKLANASRRVFLKNYPNVDDPKAGIAAFLR